MATQEMVMPKLSDYMKRKKAEETAKAYVKKARAKAKRKLGPKKKKTKKY